MVHLPSLTLEDGESHTKPLSPHGVEEGWSKINVEGQSACCVLSKEAVLDLDVRDAITRRPLVGESFWVLSMNF
jgi:hypothetical protein